MKQNVNLVFKLYNYARDYGMTMIEWTFLYLNEKIGSITLPQPTGSISLPKRQSYGLSHTFNLRMYTFSNGRYWFRTSDLFRVKEARYHCANRPGISNLA